MDDMPQDWATSGKMQQQLADLAAQNEVLKNRDRLLEANAAAAQALLTIENPDQAIAAALKIIGECLDTDRVALIEHFVSPADSYLCWQILYEWTSPGTISQLSHPDLASGNYEGIDIDALMESGQAISTLVAEMSEPFRSVQASLGVKALHAIPVLSEGLLWGAICFDDCREAKQRSTAELTILKTAASCIGSLVQRDRAIQSHIAELETQNRLLESRDRLLDATAMAVNALLTINDFEQSVNTALQILGEGLQIDRVSVLQNFTSPADSSFPYWQVMYEWNLPGIISQFSDPNAIKGSYEEIQAFYATLQQGQILSYLVEDTPEPFRSHQMAIGVKSTQIVPIFVEGQWWGVLALDDCHEAKQRSLAEILLLKIAAACVGSAIDRQAKTEELRQSEALYRSLFEISTEGIYRWQLDRPVSLSLSVDEQVDRIYQNAYFVQANDAFAPMYGREKAEDVVGLRIAATHPDKIEHTLTFIRAVVESNYQMSSAESAEVDANGQQRYFLNSIIGFIDQDCVTGGWGTQIDITELRTTQQALLQNERERAAELSEINAVLRRSANHLTTTTSLQSFPIAVLKEAIAATGAVTAGAFVHNPSTHTLQLAELILHGEVIEIATDPRTEIWRLPVPADITDAWQMATEEQIFFSDIDNPHPEFWPFSIPWHRQFGHKETATIPLSIGNKLVGLLGLCFTTAQKQTKSERELFYTLGQHAALAIRFTQLSDEAQQTTLLAERNRMARELHDTLAQTFTGVIMQLEAAQELLANTPAPVRQHLAHAGLLARQGLQEARRSVWSLRPEALETDDLHTAFLRIMQQMTDNTTIVSEVLVDGTPIVLPDEIEAHLLRIGQEALTNILKHAQTEQIKLILQFTLDLIVLRIVDHGQGFDPQQSSSGFGLTSMQQRTQQIGGIFTVTSQIGQGTTINVTIPLV